MNKHNLNYRHVHMDFHTSEYIGGIGEQFNKSQWQKTLTDSYINAVTIFAKCHHGLSYFDTKTGVRHPHLKFDLLQAQYEACREIGINPTIYITVGIDVYSSDKHPQWRETGVCGENSMVNMNMLPNGFTKLCFNSPYFDYFLEQAYEVSQLYPDCNGIFYDIINQGQCLCPACLKYMKENYLDPNKSSDRMICANRGLMRYYELATQSAKSVNPNMPVFHNSGHIAKNNLDVLKYFSHLELESLPTGGWGYDHFPMSAKFVENTDYDFMGMTGKFHTTWGEFGGFKHPNALRYEAMQTIACGAKVSIGDQLHPSGRLDKSTYDMIGTVYKEVAEKEIWCSDTKSAAEIGVLSVESETGIGNSDTGVGRVMLESKFMFNLIHRNCDFMKYKLLILPDKIRIDEDLKSKIDAYLSCGGKLILSGKSGLWKTRDEFAFDVGAVHCGESKYQPNYILPFDKLELDYVKTPLVMYISGENVKINTGKSFSDIYEPYFNKTWQHFCSHQHAPNQLDSNGFSGAVMNKIGNILYLSHPVFEIYGDLGASVYREYVQKAVNMMLEKPVFSSNLPSEARVYLRKQNDKYILHLLYANKIARGSEAKLSPQGYVYDSHKVEVIEELLPLHNIDISMHLPEKVKTIRLVPANIEISFSLDDGRVSFGLEEFICHQMLEISVGS